MEVDQLVNEKQDREGSKSFTELKTSSSDRPESGDKQKAPRAWDNTADEESCAGADERAPKDAKDGGVEVDEPVVLNRSGKGTIPYEKHKALRVENSALREQLDVARSRLEELQGQEKIPGGDSAPVTDEPLAKHLETLKNDMPALHQVISTLLDGNRRQGEKLEETLQSFRNEQEESRRVKELSIREQVAEAKDNNPDLVHWETVDPEAWEEALRQDEILRSASAWATRPYGERFEEVVRRVRAIMPDASVSLQKEKADPEQTKAHAKARLDAAASRKPVTLSDIQGGANPASEQEQIESLSPHELAKRLMQMPSQKASALRAELD